MGSDALAEIGVGFSLFETPRLAQLVARVVAEEQAARKAAKAARVPGDRRRGVAGVRPGSSAGAISPSSWRSAST